MRLRRQREPELATPLRELLRKAHAVLPMVRAAAPVAARVPPELVLANLRFRCTSSTEIAAGVMPEMRAAWPSVSGRC